MHILRFCCFLMGFGLILMLNTAMAMACGFTESGDYVCDNQDTGSSTAPQIPGGNTRENDRGNNGSMPTAGGRPLFSSPGTEDVIAGSPPSQFGSEFDHEQREQYYDRIEELQGDINQLSIEDQVRAQEVLNNMTVGEVLGYAGPVIAGGAFMGVLLADVDISRDNRLDEPIVLFDDFQNNFFPSATWERVVDEEDPNGAITVTDEISHSDEHAVELTAGLGGSSRLDFEWSVPPIDTLSLSAEFLFPSDQDLDGLTIMELDHNQTSQCKEYETIQQTGALALRTGQTEKEIEVASYDCATSLSFNENGQLELTHFSEDFKPVSGDPYYRMTTITSDVVIPQDQWANISLEIDGSGGASVTLNGETILEFPQGGQGRLDTSKLDRVSVGIVESENGNSMFVDDLNLTYL